MTTIEKDTDQMGTRGIFRGWKTLRTSMTIGALACTILGSRPAAAQDAPPAMPPADPGAAPAAPPTDAPPPAPPADAAPAPAPAPMAAPAPSPMPEPAVDHEPLAGFSNGTAFMRSPDNSFILFPNGRLQSDFYAFKDAQPNSVPKDSFILKRARLELAGWVGSFVFFQIGADFASAPPAASGGIPASQSNINATDDFVAIAPCEDRFIIQVGQFDAPFTLENRTSDKYFDFIERSLTVRAFGIPTNKEQGAMVHGTNPDRNYYYSVGVFNGDGQNFKNVDNNFDVMGRAWIAPASFMGAGPAHDITVGGSYWTGNHDPGQPLTNMSTAGGYTFLTTNPSTLAVGTGNGTLNQQGRQYSYAFEVNAPISHIVGVRWEYVHKDQPLSILDATKARYAGLHLKGYSTYFEAWGWVLGDDRIVGEPGMQMPTRLKKFGVKPPQQGVMIATRLELLDAKMTADEMGGPVSTLKAPLAGAGETKVTSWQLGVTYWMSKRFRAMGNYTINHFGGDTAFIKSIANNKNEQEFSLRLAIAL
ncbi:MAG TPA: porin [Polyangia bacterium]|nr:porin [Polyangia bacterium]